VTCSKTEVFTSQEKVRGRKETRSVTIIRKEHFPEDLNLNKNGSKKWEELNVVGRVVYESIEKDNRLKNRRAESDILSLIRTKTETRYKKDRYQSCEAGKK
jgi:hypothetical protein